MPKWKPKLREKYYSVFNTEYVSSIRGIRVGHLIWLNDHIDRKLSRLGNVFQKRYKALQMATDIKLLFIRNKKGLTKRI